MNFGEIENWILFGGGSLLCKVGLKLIEKRNNVFVVTSERHLREHLIDFQNITMEDFLRKNNIDYICSNNVNSDSEVIGKISKHTVGISMGAAWLFKDSFINLFEGKLVNFHGTRLPQDRGGGGFSWRILRNDRLGFSVIHQVDSGVDTGNIIKYKEYIFPLSCRLPIDYQHYSLGKDLVIADEFIDDVINGISFNLVKQQEYLSTYWPRLYTDIHGYIDWRWSLKDIEQFICAFDDPYNGSITFLNDVKVRLKKCFPIVSDGIFHPFQKGIIYKISDSGLFVATEDGTLIIQSVSDENGNNFMSKLQVGDRFYTPIKYIEEANQYRAFYSPKGLL